MIVSERVDNKSKVSQNGTHPEAKVAVPPENVVYKHLDSYDLTPGQVVSTLKSYSEAALNYSEKEWDIETIMDMWRHVFVNYRDIIKNLPDNALVLMTGVGTARDAFFMTLLKQGLRVIASDATRSMLDVAQDRLSWENYLKLIEFMENFDKTEGSEEEYRWFITQTGALIKGIAENMAKIDELTGTHTNDRIPLLSVYDKKGIIDGILKRTIFSQENISQLAYADNTFDMAMSVAVFPHLPKDDVLPAVLEALRVLKPGSVFYFDLRTEDAEHWDAAEKGRTFMDTAIGGERFFTTYTRKEINRLIAKLQKIMPGLQIIDRDINPHQDPNKPSFAHIGMVKAAA